MVQLSIIPQLTNSVKTKRDYPVRPLLLLALLHAPVDIAESVHFLFLNKTYLLYAQIRLPYHSPQIPLAGNSSYS